MPPASHGLGIVLSPEDVFARDLQPASKCPQFDEPLDLKNGALSVNRHVNHPRMILSARGHPLRFRDNLETMDPTTVFTDGAAKGNPGPGGWGAIVVTPDAMVTELEIGSGWCREGMTASEQV